jgi:flagellar L-ring protein FlgH
MAALQYHLHCRGHIVRLIKLFTISTALVFSLSACVDSDRLARIGEPPAFATIENPTHEDKYEPVSMPMPAPITAERKPNSLWQAGARAFFRDQRAARVGDILTILISIKDKAKLENKTDSTQTSDQGLNVDNILGLQSNLDRVHRQQQCHVRQW